MATAQETFHTALIEGAKRVKYVEDKTKEGEPTGRMVIHEYQNGAGRFATGVTIGTVVIGGTTYEVRSKEVVTLHPVKAGKVQPSKPSLF